MMFTGKKIKVLTPQKRYAEAFKRQVVREYETGVLNKDQLMVRYGIKGHSLVLEWCRKYGRLAYPKQVSQGRPMKDIQKQRLKELEKALEMAHLKIAVYEKAIELIQEKEGIEVLKKSGLRSLPDFKEPGR
ncbi:hypothetical protein L6Q79_07875 [bacterium]|nr:hypothetical protein [bacterium]NUN45663.1 hypothetical protein [bacterium]